MENGDAEKKGRGRPKKSEANGNSEKKTPAKKKEPKKAATESGQPRRSSRTTSGSKPDYAE